MPEYVALYRKYRPKIFQEVLGQEHITEALRQSVESGKIPHAYLFAGSRGTGKTSVARILARALGVNAHDLHEIDAASNRGIDDIRALREAMHTLPYDSPYKCYIIDECHMLTREAFNALLKTLEEPPEHVFFVLATTEIEKVPETVISRCEIHTFRKPAQKILKSLVLDVAKKEGSELEPACADLIAMLGEGSYRDTIGMLQKVINCSANKKITIEETEAVLGAPRGAIINETIKGIAERNIEKGLMAVNAASEASVDTRIFLKILMHKIRMILLLRYAKDMKEQIRNMVSEEDFEFISEMAGSSGAAINSAILLEFITASEATDYATIAQLPLELALIKLLGEYKNDQNK